MNSGKVVDNPSKPENKFASVAELIGGTLPELRPGYDADPSSLPRILTRLALEYIERLRKVGKLDRDGLARIESIEAFHEKLTTSLCPEDREQVETQLRAFINIKYQYRDFPDEMSCHTLQ